MVCSGLETQRITCTGPALLLRCHSNFFGDLVNETISNAIRKRLNSVLSLHQAHKLFAQLIIQSINIYSMQKCALY